MKTHKYQKGDKVKFQSKVWTVCTGGCSDPQTKNYRYRLSRGAWKKLIPGNQIRGLVNA